VGHPPGDGHRHHNGRLSRVDALGGHLHRLRHRKTGIKIPEKFGTGVIEGVASPEAANNANCQAGFIPLFALGIPTTPIAAMLLASLMIYGLPVGPMLFKQHGDFAWTVVASMYIGNVMLLILNLPLVGLWARLCLIPYRIIGPIVLGAVMVGAYSIRNSMFDVWSAILFGLAGYVMKNGGGRSPPSSWDLSWAP